MRRLFGLCVISFSACVLFVSMFVPVSFSSQPPINTTTFFEGNIGWGPRRADPARAYDTGSGELVFNCYETLIAWNEESYYDFVPQLATNVPNRTDITLIVTNTSTVDFTSPSTSTWTDGATNFTCVGYYDFNGLIPGFSQSDVIYLSDGTAYRTWFLENVTAADAVTNTITLDLCRGSYTFNIRTNPTINFWNETGAPVDTFEIDDAEYSFKRALLQDQLGSPQWMFYKPLLGTMNSDPFANNVTAPTAMTLAHLVDNAVEKNGNDLTINLGIRFPDNAFKETLSQTWGSIVSKEFSISIGCWNADLYSDSNGDGYPDWWTTVRGISRSSYDTTGKYRYCGTGPYRIATFNQAGMVVVMQKNPSYWRGWPATGSNSSLDTIEIDYIPDWTTRKTMYLAGSIDTCAVPRANMMELLNPITREPDPSLSPNMKTIKNLIPTFSYDAYQYTFTLDQGSPHIGSGHFPDGIPLNFFNNTHVRRAFAYSFNHSKSISDVWFGEAITPVSPLIPGLYPDYHNVTTAYDINYSAAETELKGAIFNGTSVWSTGFTLAIPYQGDDSTRLYALMIRTFFQILSTYDGRVGSPFTVNPVNIDFTTFLNQWEAHQLPMFWIGWLADFTDADNFIRPYMHSNGDFSWYQNYTLANGWGNTHGTNYPTLNKDQLIDLALVTPDGPDRAKMYSDLENIYMTDCPSFALEQPYLRRWCQYWVKGWYYNPLYPSSYFYILWKQDNCWCDASGPTLGVSDGIVNMRDISWLIQHFGARAFILGYPADPKWIGVYGANGCIDPDGDRLSNMRDLQKTINHFEHRMNTTTP